MGSWTGQYGGARCHKARRPRCGFLRLGTVREGCAVRRTGVSPGDKEKGAIALSPIMPKAGPLSMWFLPPQLFKCSTDYINYAGGGVRFQHYSNIPQPCPARCPNAFLTVIQFR